MEIRGQVLLMVSPWLSLCWRPWAASLGPRTFSGPPLHLPAWKGGGTPSSHSVEGPGSSHILLGHSQCPQPHSVPCGCLHSRTSSLAALGMGTPGQRGQLRFREAKSLAWSHPTRKWQSHNLNPGGLTLLSPSPSRRCWIYRRNNTNTCPCPWGADI